MTKPNYRFEPEMTHFVNVILKFKMLRKFRTFHNVRLELVSRTIPHFHFAHTLCASRVVPETQVPKEQ